MNINTISKTKEILRKYDIKAKKRFGQNFLIDDNILSNIVNVANLSSNDLIIEIGPGLGNLTEYLLQTDSYCLLIEIDKNMIDILNDRFELKKEKYMLINNDVLELNLDEIVEDLEKKLNKKFEKVKVVANLPYYITTPIIFKLLQDSKKINDIIVMVQKEVAERMVAKNNTKDYGILTLMIEYMGIGKIEFIVDKNSFIPAPDVTSAVISIHKQKRFNICDEKLLFNLIHLSFANRRKKMINSLQMNNFNNMTKKELESVFTALKIDFNARAEQLPLESYIKIIEYIKTEHL